MTAVSLSPERWGQVFDAVDRALELAPEEREAFIERCSTDDPALGAELRALLKSAETPSALDRSAAAFAGSLLAELSSEPDQPASASRIGPYRMVESIGRGGMGAVYLAERADDQYRKRVALKLLLPWSATDEHRVRRFVEERQILAALEHPDIARLLDGGVTPDGLPWFAMEYVEGVPIDRYCDERGLSIERRLDLFCRVCAAVSYAHRNLVVHRDLKPSNILVSSDGGGVKLLDFGIAKLLGGEAAGASAALTHTGDQVMTPLYASPEQIRSEPVSTASDVYALGVLLYQLLAGRHPYLLPTGQPHEIARAILEQEPERPSTAVVRAGVAPESSQPGSTPEQVATRRATTPAKLIRCLRGDLDAITLKAVEKSLVDRYGSAEQLEADVRRHLAGLPVAAGPPSRLYQARKFVRRHKIGVAVTTGVTLLVLGFALVTMVQSLRIRAQAEQIATEQNRAEAVLRVMLNVYRTAVPSPGEGRGVTAKEVLDSSAALIERDSSADPGTRARLLLGMGRSYDELGFPGRARELLEASVALRRRSRGLPIALATTLDALGGVLLEQGELDGAERTYEDALALRRKLLGARHGDVARTLSGLAAVRLAQRRIEEAELLSRSALAIDRERSGDNQIDLAESLRGVGHARREAGDYAEAARLYEQALVLLRQKLPNDENLDVAGTVLDLASALRGKGENAAADSLLRYGLALQRRVAATPVLSAILDSAWLRILTPPPPKRGSARSFASRIAFESDRDRPDPIGNLGHHEIYVMNPDGSDQRRLTHSNGRVAAPAISPDGTRIAYHTTWGKSDIFVIDAGGGEPVRVTNMAALGLGATNAAWSTDGKRLAFSGGVPADIYVINLDGTGLKNLTNHPARDARPTWSPRGDKIAFVSDRDGSLDIYLMNADGTEPLRLVVSAKRDSDPSWSPGPKWSPDGHKLAFTSDRDGNREIYVINADGTGLARLTDNPAEDVGPSWSPDGRQIVFNRRVLGHYQIFVMNADGGQVTRLTEVSPVVGNAFPSWGPAPPADRGPTKVFASMIAFESDRDGPDPVGHLGQHEIYVMNPDGSGQRRLTHSDGWVGAPAISPDGAWIAFHTTHRGEKAEIFMIAVTGGEPIRVTNMAALALGARAPAWAPDGRRIAFQSVARPDIYVINRDGTGLRNLTNHPSNDARPTWSPDGRKIAFVSDRDGSPDVYVMNAEGTDPVRLTSHAVSLPDSSASRGWWLRPDWSPDGRKIAFTSDRDGNREIYVINADGSGLSRLTDDPAEDGHPSWSPDGRQIAFPRRVLGHHQIFVMNADGSAAKRLTELSPVVFNGFPDWGPRPPMGPRAGPPKP